MLRQMDLTDGFNIPVPYKLYPVREEIYDHNAFFEI